MFKLALTAGHYMNTPGKRCLKTIDPSETREWWLNNRIADKIEELLAQYEGISILRTDDTTGEKDVSLSKRVTEANNFDADFYLSIHHNAGINGGKGGGIMAYVYTKASNESRRWQTALYDELIEKTGLKGNRSQPIAQANFYEVKNTTMPAVLLELGFMDSTVDTPIILTDAYANKCAEACVNVIVERASLKKKEVPAPSPKPTRVKNLKRGMKGEDVRRMQLLLNLLGYNCGAADGSFGAKTEKGVVAFQKAMKIEQDGIFGTTSYNTLKRCITTTKLVFKKGKKGDQVAALQAIINAYGHDCGRADGSFGGQTQKGVKSYQKSRGLEQDGKAGPKTIGTFVDFLVL